MEGLGRGWGQPVQGDRAGALNTGFSVTEGVGDRFPFAYCLLSPLKSKLLSPSR